MAALATLALPYIARCAGAVRLRARSPAALLAELGCSIVLAYGAATEFVKSRFYATAAARRCRRTRGSSVRPEARRSRRADGARRLWPNRAFAQNLGADHGQQDRHRSRPQGHPAPAAPTGVTVTTQRGQKVSLERGSHTRSKKNPGKRAKKGG